MLRGNPARPNAKGKAEFLCVLEISLDYWKGLPESPELMTGILISMGGLNSIREEDQQLLRNHLASERV